MDMEKKVKVRIIVCSVLAVFSFFLYIILGFFEKEERVKRYFIFLKE